MCSREELSANFLQFLFQKTLSAQKTDGGIKNISQVGDKVW